MTQPDLSAFKDVNAWVFDLDNTLYPRDTGLHLQMDVRIRDFVANALKISLEDAHQVQKGYYRDHGTTLRGLMNDHGIVPEHFLDYVHKLDYTPIVRNEALSAAMARLPGAKYVFTNGDLGHAQRVTDKLGIAHHFEAMFDIVAAELEPKPAAVCYERFLAHTGIEPTRAAMFEDLARNLAVPHAIGMRTVLIVPRIGEEDVRYAWESTGIDEPHVHHCTTDFALFIDQLADFLTTD